MERKYIYPVLPCAAGIIKSRGLMPTDLIGATIVAIGMPNTDHSFEGGGMAIEYIPKGKKTVVQIFFCFNENGMWVER